MAGQRAKRYKICSLSTLLLVTVICVRLELQSQPSKLTDLLREIRFSGDVSNYAWKDKNTLAVTLNSMRGFEEPLVCNLRSNRLSPLIVPGIDRWMPFESKELQPQVSPDGRWLLWQYGDRWIVSSLSDHRFYEYPDRGYTAVWLPDGSGLAELRETTNSIEARIQPFLGPATTSRQVVLDIGGSGEGGSLVDLISSKVALVESGTLGPEVRLTAAPLDGSPRLMSRSMELTPDDARVISLSISPAKTQLAWIQAAEDQYEEDSFWSRFGGLFTRKQVEPFGYTWSIWVSNIDGSDAHSIYSKSHLSSQILPDMGDVYAMDKVKWSLDRRSVDLIERGKLWSIYLN